jgi:hypothetical protein
MITLTIREEFRPLAERLTDRDHPPEPLPPIMVKTPLPPVKPPRQSSWWQKMLTLCPRRTLIDLAYEAWDLEIGGEPDTITITTNDTDYEGGWFPGRHRLMWIRDGYGVSQGFDPRLLESSKEVALDMFRIACAAWKIRDAGPKGESAGEGEDE